MNSPRTIGILANKEFRHEAERIATWASLSWGTDAVTDAVSRVSRREIDTLVVEARVAFLTAELLGVAAKTDVTVIALDVDGSSATWLGEQANLTIVRSLDELRGYLATSMSTSTTPSTHSALPFAPLTSKLVAVWGPPGAPGVTTTAISLSALAARDGNRVMLCDADTRGASVSIALELLDEVPGFAAASRLAGRGELTASEIDRLALTAGKAGSGFAVLTGLPRASRWSEIAPAKSLAVLAELSTRWDVVVVDVGSSIEENEWIDNAPQRDGAAREILRKADVVVAVGAANPVGISRLIRGLDDLRDICVAPLVVLNAVTRTSAAEAKSAIERFTAHEVTVTVARDGRSGIGDAVSKSGAFSDVWAAVKLAMVTPSLP